jgi:ribulose 1,5-bisphosphate carboxylase large subunit-like protein
MIEINVKIIYKNTEPPPSETDVYNVVGKINDDAIYGTFGKFPEFWRGKWEQPPQNIASFAMGRQVGDRQFNFTLYLNEVNFPVEPAGFQNLIGVIAGDLFYTKSYDSRIESLNIEDIVLPEPIISQAIRLFRSARANNTNDIINRFKLNKLPLLAFSFKPRVGIEFSEMKKVALGVLKAGFNIVEIDTRNFILDEHRVNQLIELATEAANLNCHHITRFSPNLSVPAPYVLELSNKFYKAYDDPIIYKIDGGLDGISSTQYIRRNYQEEGQKKGLDRKPPIITCYPLLRRQLEGKEPRIPSDFFVKILALSGVDIIYPGGAPNLGSGFQTIDTSIREKLITSINRYRKFISAESPMVSIAGGINIGALHAFYELLGPNVAYFLGGTVALHRKGPIDGAKLCVEILQEAKERREEAGKNPVVKDLSNKLKKRIESAYDEGYSSDNERTRYVSPKELLKEIQYLESWFLSDNK